MSDVEELIREVAAKHDVPISMDDPIAVLITVNNRLIADFQKSLKEELAKSTQAWSEEARQKAEKILNAALDTGRESALDILHSGAEGLPEIASKAMREEISKQLSPILQKIEHLARINTVVMIGTAIALIVGLVVLIFLK